MVGSSLGSSLSPSFLDRSSVFAHKVEQTLSFDRNDLSFLDDTPQEKVVPPVPQPKKPERNQTLEVVKEETVEGQPEEEEKDGKQRLTDEQKQELERSLFVRRVLDKDRDYGPNKD